MNGDRRIPANRFLRLEVDDELAAMIRKQTIELDTIEEAHLFGYNESDGGSEILITRENFVEVARKLACFRMRDKIARAYLSDAQALADDQEFLRSLHIGVA